MLDDFSIQPGSIPYVYKGGKLYRMSYNKKTKKENPIPVSLCFWVYSIDTLRISVSTERPRHEFLLDIYVDGKQFAKVEITPEDMSTPFKLATFLAAVCGVLPLDPRLIAEIDTVSRCYSFERKADAVEISCFGWLPEGSKLKGYYAPTHCTIKGTIHDSAKLPSTQYGGVSVVPCDDDIAKNLDLVDATDKEVREAIRCVLADVVRWWPNYHALPLVGAAFMAPWMEKYFKDHLRPYYWIYGPHQSGKSLLLSYLLRFFGPTWSNTSLPGISSTTSGTLSRLKYYAHAICPLDDAKSSLFLTQREAENFLTVLHQSTMGRGRDRASREGFYSKRRSTRITGTLMATAEQDVSDFGGKGIGGALLSRGIRLITEPHTLDLRRELTSNVERHSRHFSAITLRCLAHLQESTHSPRSFLNLAETRLERALRENRVQSDTIGRQTEVWRYSLAGLFMLQYYIKDWHPEFSRRMIHLIRVALDLAVDSLHGEAANTLSTQDWWLLIDSTIRLKQENHAQMVWVPEDKCFGEPDYFGDFTSIRLMPDIDLKRSRPVIGLTTTRHYYLYSAAITKLARDKLEIFISKRVATRQLVKMTAPMILDDGGRMDVSPLVFRQLRGKLRTSVQIRVHDDRPYVIILRKDALHKILDQEATEALDKVPRKEVR